MQSTTDELLLTDLVFCSAFVEIAKQEIDLGDPTLAQRIVARAETVYWDALGQIMFARDGIEKRTLQGKLTSIRARLDILKSEIRRIIAY
jgi:hypothetical protein